MTPTMAKQSTKKQPGKKTVRRKAPAKAAQATKADKARARRILAKLEELYPDAETALNYSNPFELLVATILSAQCTDERVNMTTPALFKKYPTPEKMAEAKQADLETLIKSTGFYRNKAKSIRGAAQRIVEDFGGEVPQTMDELLTLPGVARKTANVVLGNAFDIDVGVVVDTHVKRLSHRLGFTEHTNPDKIEQDLMAQFPQEKWTELAHLLIFHGRAVCQARKPDCENCALLRSCPQIGVK